MEMSLTPELKPGVNEIISKIEIRFENGAERWETAWQKSII